MEYKPRVVDKLLDFKLKSAGAVLVEGPKWCGKTTTAEQFAKSAMRFGDSSEENQDLSLARASIKKALEGEEPRLFDEWQVVPELWDAVRSEVDKRNGTGHFILTGSAVPPSSSEIKHTGTGRYSWLKMRPMTLFESGESNGSVSLAELFNSPEDFGASCEMDLDRLAFLTCRGGWPQATTLEGEYALSRGVDYYDAIVHSDISRIDGVTRNPRTAMSLLRSYARNQGSQTSIEEITADVGESSSKTIHEYIDVLAKLFVIEDMPAWNPNLRSKTAIRTSDTRYFVDPSIATSALGVGPDGLISDIRTFGFIFETLCMRDLRVYAEALGGEVYHYRDKNELECDAVITLRDGKYGLVQLKLGSGEEAIDSAAETLTALSDKIDTEKMNAPSFKMILVGNGKYAYRRPDDGIYVVPIACLKD